MNAGLTSVGFVLLLCLPLLRWSVSGDEAASVERENRRAPVRPELTFSTWRQFPARFEAWFKDAYPFRSELVRLHALGCWTLLGQSPSRRMLRGREDWLFNTDLHALPVHLGLRPFSYAELEAWRTALEGRRDWLAQHGIEYLFAIAPDKTSIYAERLPARLGPPGRSRLDQLVEHLARHSDLTIADLRPALLAEKQNDGPDDHVQFPHGTHWTERGAHAAYRSLLPRLGAAFEDQRPIDARELQPAPLDGPGDSWLHRLHLDGLATQAELRLECHEPEPFEHDSTRWRTSTSGMTRQDAPSLPKLHVVHDSYGVELRRFLAHHTSELSWRWQLELDLASIEALAPDAVLQVHGESILNVSLPTFVGGSSGEVLRAEFEAAQQVLHRLPQDLGEFEPRGALGLTPQDGHLLLALDASDHALLLPERSLPSGMRGLLALEFELQEPTTITLRVGSDPRETGERRHVLSQSLEPGSSSLHLKLWQLDPGERLMLSFGGPASAIVLRQAELRAAHARVPDPVPEDLGR